MKCLLLLVLLSMVGQTSFAGKWQGLKQRVAPLSKKIAGGIAVVAVGTTLLTAPLSSIDAHRTGRYAKAANEAAGFNTNHQANDAHNWVAKLAEVIDEEAERARVTELPKQLYSDMQILREAADLELLGTFGVFDVEILRHYAGLDLVIARYEALLRLRLERSDLTGYFNSRLGLAVSNQYNTVSFWAKNLKGQLPSTEMIPSSLESLYLWKRADLWQLTDQYVLQVISREDYLAKKDDLLAQTTKDINAQKRQRIRNMTRTSRFGGYRK